MWKEQVLLRTAEETTAPPKGTAGDRCAHGEDIYTSMSTAPVGGGRWGCKGGDQLSLLRL